MFTILKLFARFKFKSFIYLSVVSFLSFNCFANSADHRLQKSFIVQKLSIEQGLSQSVVYDIEQDDQGYIWVATEDGLNRFNGYEFTVFEHKHSDPNSLHENLVYSLTVQDQKGLWLGTQNGLSFFDFKNQSFKNYNKHTDLNLAGISAIQLTKDNRLFIGSENGLYVLDNDQIIKLYLSDQHDSIDEEVIGFDLSPNTLWLTTHSCPYSINLTTNQLTNYCQPENTIRLSSNDENRVSQNTASQSMQTNIIQVNQNSGFNYSKISISQLSDLRTITYFDEKLWLGSNQGLIVHDFIANESQIYQHLATDPNSLSSDVIQAVEVDNNNRLWIGTTQGANVYDPTTESFKRYQNLALNQDGLSSNDIMSIFSDANNMLWLGTYTGGLNLIDPQQTSFNHLLSKSDLAQFNSPNVIHGITKDNRDNLWLASYGGGLLKLNMMTGEISQPFSQLSNKAESDHPFIYSLLIDSQNYLWVGVTDGLKIIDLNTNQYISPQVFIDGVATNFDDYIFTFYQDHQGKIWIGSIAGFYLVDSLIKQNDQLTLSLKNKTHLLPTTFRERNRWVVSILQTNDGDYWFGGPAGLVHHNTQTDTWQHYKHQDNNPQSLSYDDVQVLFEDSRSNLWVGTAHGLNKVIRDQSQHFAFERVTKENGLSNNVIYGILEDKFHQLWLSTNYGLIQYNQNIKNNYSRKDGLSSNEFNKSAYYSDEAGRLYFGSINGVTMIDSLIHSNNKHLANIKLTALKIGNRQLDVESLNLAESPQIAQYKNEKVISLAIADLYYKKLGRSDYRYRLTGLNAEWINLGFERKIVLANLPEGEYQLQIQSRLGNDSWHDKSFVMQLSVETNFWQSRYAIPVITLIIIIIAAIILFLIQRYYTTKVNKLNARISIGGLHLKEAKNEKSELEQLLRNKSNENNVIQKNLTEKNNQLESMKFKNITSGFFNYSNIEKVMTQFEQGNLVTTTAIQTSTQHKSGFTNLDTQPQKLKNRVPRYNLFMVIQVSQFQSLINKHGELVASEVIAYIAKHLKRSSSSDSQIFSLADSKFVLLANTEQKNKITQALINFQHKIAQSEIPVANGLMVNSGVSMSFLEIYPDKIEESIHVINLMDMVADIHKQYNPTTHSELMRIDLNQKINYYLSKNNDVKRLVESNNITLHFIEN